MTLSCVKCGPQFLQIVASRVNYDPETGTINELEEDFECTFCGATGHYHYDGSDPRISGDVTRTVDRPRDGTEVAP